MHSIGDLNDALTILHWVRESETVCGLPDVVEDGIAPEGWEYIDRGSFRSVWLSPEGVAYKVDHVADRWSGQCQNEVRLLGEAWTKGTIEGCRLPKFSEYKISDDETVVAIELIRGELLGSYYGSPTYRKYCGLMQDLERWYRLDDMHDSNVMIDEDGLLVPIDFGA